MVSIAMFNNKGGVGKTTLTNNIASFISDEHQKRVLVVDCDPQCNTTQLLMGQEFAVEFYWGSKNRENVTTISDILQEIADGEAQIIDRIVPIKSSDNRFNIDLIPGDPSFSTLEDRLSDAWQKLIGGAIEGIRRTNWNYFLLKKIEERYDFVFYDLGPSLGSINRSVLIGCDYFMTPMGTDIFSIIGIRNIAYWMNTWIAIYENALINCERLTPGKIHQYHIPSKLNIAKGYLGYTIQQYITKTIKGQRRPTQAYDEIIQGVPSVIEQSLGEFSVDILSPNELKLGDVPHLYSLIPLAQSSSSPILKLKGSDGLVSSQFKQKDEYGKIVSGIVGNLLNNLTKLKNNELA